MGLQDCLNVNKYKAEEGLHEVIYSKRGQLVFKLKPTDTHHKIIDPSVLKAPKEVKGETEPERIGIVESVVN